MKNFETLSTLKALSQESRWEIVAFLAANPRSCAGDIARNIGVPPSTLSFHLKQLTDADVLEARNRGRETYYHLAPGALEEVIESLRRLLTTIH
jgi:DNA-binding transcriptional ArsR family regulator